MQSTTTILFQEAIDLLKALISQPSFSREEDRTATIIEQFFQKKQIPVNRFLNNVWVVNQYFDPVKPVLLLNSHHDTVKPNPAYTLDPFAAIEKEGKLFGLGSNDAGGALVALLAVFLYYYEQQDLPYNILFAATAEEEISGKNGIEALLPHLPNITCGIVGEPTQMQMAIAERGLLVLDVTAQGKPGHAARNEGENALYKAIKDIEWFSQYQFEKVSDLLGPVKMSVTVIETENKAHNVVPAICKFVVDVRVNELYSFEEILTTIQKNIQSTAVPRSLRIKSTAIPQDHPLVVAGTKLGRSSYGSPTTSDKALMPFLTLKMGPGDSARSHSADEFIYLTEIKEGIDLYIALIDQFMQNQTS
ncbi:M20 family metallo-hydrolase [Sediminibacterium sp. KACHI17]|jgi:acetylornithine deacetylase|uniref:M20 family metallo-hydrolase n=1 Tax=Sediminibacterium sp. KACHI17 TaxID=1751071 RepID=A0AAT9GJL0_9BACT